MSKTILYVRVSTSEQTSDHQREQASMAGFHIDEVVTDHGTSGVSTSLSERENGKRLFDLLRAGDTLVVRWVDRLGRNYRDVTDTLREFLRRGVTVRTVINSMVFDAKPKTPMDEAVRDALIAFMAAQAEAQAQATKEAQAAGIAFHRTNNPDKFKGRKPGFDRAQFEEVKALLGAGAGSVCNRQGHGVEPEHHHSHRQGPGQSRGRAGPLGSLGGLASNLRLGHR